MESLKKSLYLIDKNYDAVNNNLNNDRYYVGCEWNLFVSVGGNNSESEGVPYVNLALKYIDKDKNIIRKKVCMNISQFNEFYHQIGRINKLLNTN